MYSFALKRVVDGKELMPAAARLPMFVAIRLRRCLFLAVKMAAVFVAGLLFETFRDLLV